METKSGGWALARGARETRRRFREGRERLPAGALRRWFTILAVGWGIGAIVAAGLSAVGERLAERGMAKRDLALLEKVVANEKFSFQAAIWFDAWGSSAMLIPLTAVAVVVAARLRRPLVALTLFAAYLLHDLLVWVGWTVWDRARPSVVADGIAVPPLHSFPSGHAVQLIAVYGLLAYLWTRRSGSVAERALAAALVAAVTAVVSYARLRLGTHWPSDIVAGVVIGSLWLAVCMLALRAGERTPG